MRVGASSVCPTGSSWTGSVSVSPGDSHSEGSWTTLDLLGTDTE